MHDDFFVLIILMAAMAFTSAYFFGKKLTGQIAETKLNVVLGVGTAIYGMILIWLVTHSVMAEDTATMTSLIVYTLVGLTLYIRGKIQNMKAEWVLGIFVLSGVIARLLLVEVWNMALTGRIITFCVIGVLLISTAFISRSKPSNKE